MIDNGNGFNTQPLTNVANATNAIPGMTSSNSTLDQTSSDTLSEMSQMMKSQQAFQTKLSGLQTESAMFNAAMELLKSLTERIERSAS